MRLSELMQKGSLRQFATVTVATTATVRVKLPPSVASVATVNVATAQKQAANDPTTIRPDPDRWCWPHSDAMNTGEINTLTARLARFTDKGLSLDDSEALADKLVLRDRDEDDRRVCLECKHFTGHGPGSCRCGNWQAAGVAVHPRDTRLAADLVVQLQRCDGFAAHPTSKPQGTQNEHDRH